MGAMEKVEWRVTLLTGTHLLVRSQGFAVDHGWLLFLNDPDLDGEAQYADPGIVTHIPVAQVASVRDNARNYVRSGK